MIISTNVKRKNVNFESEMNEDIKDTFIHNPCIHMLHKLDIFDINSVEKYETLLEILDNIETPNMIDTHFSLCLSSKRDTYVKLSNFEEYAKESDLSFLDLYNKTIDKATAIDRNLKKSMRAVLFIEELSSLKDIKFISHIIFPWTKNRSAENFIEILKERANSLRLEYIELIIVWIDMEVLEVAKLIDWLHSMPKRIISSVKKLDEILNLVDLVNEKILSTRIRISNKNPYLAWDTIYKKKSNTISLKDWFIETNSGNDEALIAIKNWKIIYSKTGLNTHIDQQIVKLSEITEMMFDIEKSPKSKTIDSKESLFISSDEISFSKELMNSHSKYLSLWDEEAKQAINEKLDSILKWDWVEVKDNYMNKLAFNKIKVNMSLI